jgi:hypothetical protein
VDDDAEYVIRPMVLSDTPFVLQTWMHSFRMGSDWARRMHLGIYRDYHRIVMNDILRRPSVRVYAAGPTRNEKVIYGYLLTEHGVARRDVVHYVYVKEPFRQLGLTKALVAASGINPYRVYFTHFTKDRMEYHQGNCNFDPTKSPPCHCKPWPRWRGAETLLRKWPEAHTERDPKTKKPKFTDGNLWVPYLS